MTGDGNSLFPWEGRDSPWVIAHNGPSAHAVLDLFFKNISMPGVVACNKVSWLYLYDQNSDPKVIAVDGAAAHRNVLILLSSRGQVE